MITETPDAGFKEHEQKLLSIFHAAPVGIGMVVNRVIVEANDTLCEITGYDMHDLIGKNTRMLYPDDSDYDFAGCEQYRQISENGRGAVETRWIRKDGTIIHIILSSTAMERDKFSSGIAFTVFDITAKKNAELALARSEARYRELVELAVDGILVASPEGVIFEANTSAETITGCRREELLGKNVCDFFTPDELSRKPIRFDLLRKGEVVLQERDYIRKDGRTISLEIHSRMMPDGTLQSIIHDVTEEKRMLESLQRVRKLESLATLTGGITHDFNNMLGGILGYIDMARNFSRKGENVTGYLDKALTIFDRARNLTAQLMTFSSGGDPCIRSGDLSPVLNEYARSALKDSGIECVFDVPDDLWPCDFDDRQIGQVVFNIVTNSRDFMESDGGVSVEAANVEITDNRCPPLKPGRYVRVTITDRGRGIPQAILPHIFDPFYTTKTKGNGLGLSTSYSIVLRHRGFLDLESSPGKGTVVWFYLPASSPELAMPAPPVHLKTGHRGSGTFLVMDDEVFIREVIAGMLENMGYCTIQASDGKEVIHGISNYGSDSPLIGIILDLTVPGGMGGLETVRELQKMNIAVPVFAASGYSGDRVMSNPGEFGFTDSIRKPFTMEEFSTLINRYIR